MPEDLRARLREPLGELITGSKDEVIGKIRSLVEDGKPLRVVSVGDRVSRLLIEHGVNVDLIVVDWREGRKPCVDPLQPCFRHVFRVSNRPGCLEAGAWNAVGEALMRGSSAVIVDGEEDLLVLAAAVQAPQDTLIFYGQPGVGVVAVKVTGELKHFLEGEILSRFIVE
ncbi:MAG: DUF359 domain-containing protein [Candidatus Bathyarchaeia archaeon]|nr:DUF359 domain-containing protein [Candidatus Bathyarchaeota archaeon]